jgi:oligopeptide/dipeptide ABC transporter ATP-binding protein
MPSLAALPEGCVFAPRCVKADEACRRERPVIERLAAGHEVRCIHHD